jgi:hypothetical protein
VPRPYDIAKEVIHVYIRCYLSLLFLLVESRNKGVLTVLHDSYDTEALVISPVPGSMAWGRITRPVYLRLLPGLTLCMHGYPTLLLILANVVAELRTHQWLSVVKATVFKILGPK